MRPRPFPDGTTRGPKVFTPDAQPPSAAATAKIHVSGTLKVQAAIALDSVPANTVQATVFASVNDQTYSNTLVTEVTVTRSGNTGTVNVSIPYIFTVLNTSETLTVSLYLFGQQPPAFRSPWTV